MRNERFLNDEEKKHHEKNKDTLYNNGKAQAYIHFLSTFFNYYHEVTQ